MSWSETSGSPAVGRRGLVRLTTAMVWLTVFAGGFVFIEPAPYEVAFALLCCAVLIKGVRFPQLLVLPLGCLTLWIAGGILSVTAGGSGSDAVVYMSISAYLALTTILFAALVAEQPERKTEIFRNAYVAAAAISAVAGIAGYFHLLPGAEMFTNYGRVRGFFKDPNVFSPFLIFPALLLFQDVLSSTQRKTIMAMSGLVLFLAAILLSFSRASWGHLILSGTLMAGLMFATSYSNRLRLKIIACVLIGLFAAGAVIAGLLAIPSVNELFAMRAELAQDYDSGATGRFGTQLRAIPDLLERPFGFGPYGFSNHYLQDPHNVYLNAFSSYGWLGGLSYLGFVLVTWLIGFRFVLIR
ncbi:MAG: O-antigen ligase family protein, partial [Hyphomicrobiales bacterium]|nr:O-antigen ligase family protein [Hyphomicrobiales bacterium]